MEKGILLLVIGLVIGLILGGIGTYGYLTDEDKAGPEGPQGDIGDIGLPGAPGDVGEKGEKGDTGDTGERGPRGPIGPKGAKGDDGEDGTDGVDLEPNDAPTIDVNDSESYVEGMPCPSYYHDDFWFCLNITTNDTEDDTRKIYVYYRTDVNDDWSYGEAYPNTNNTGYITFCKEFSGNYYYGDRTLYWLVECADGENLIYTEGSTVLSKLPCP